jgi:HlyD family secretion protein
VDAFKDRKFTGVVTAVANSALGSGLSSSLGGGGGGGSGQSQQATQFEVRIRVSENEPAFRPGMSVTAEIETEYRTNALTVPLASVTTRPMKPELKADPPKKGGTNSTASASSSTNGLASAKESLKPTDVVFVVKGDHVTAVPIKIGFCDDNYWEITDGLTNGEEIVSGGYRAVGRDLQDGSKIRVGPAGVDTEAQKK